MARILVILKGKVVEAILSDVSPIGKAVCQMLPITSKINTWGDELYFPLKLNKMLNAPVEVVNVGDIAYSETWEALCIFYGRTPLSNNLEIVPNGPVEVIGRLEEDPSILKNQLSGCLREKRRRVFNRIHVLRKYVETIKIERC